MLISTTVQVPLAQGMSKFFSIHHDTFQGSVLVSGSILSHQATSYIAR
jgi:hypothetical protein